MLSMEADITVVQPANLSLVMSTKEAARGWCMLPFLFFDPIFFLLVAFLHFMNLSVHLGN